MTFFIVIFHLSIGKAARNAPRLSKFRKECVTSISQGATVFVVAFPGAAYRPCSAFDKGAMKFHLPPSHLVSKLPLKKQGCAQKL
jgi:hypothetical protein